jgi:hypothetical protein
MSLSASLCTTSPRADRRAYDFTASALKQTMEPLIPAGSWCLFHSCPAGSREGRIVLVQFASLSAGENGGRFAVTKYHSEKTVTADGWRHDRIKLLPVNLAFEPIEIEPERRWHVILVADFVHPLIATFS